MVTSDYSAIHASMEAIRSSEMEAVQWAPLPQFRKTTTTAEPAAPADFDVNLRDSRSHAIGGFELFVAAL